MDDAVPWTSLLELTAASILMVVAMVHFLGALVDARPSTRRRWIWGGVYTSTWVVIVHAIGRLAAGETSAHAVPLAIMATAGWTTINALWLRFWLAIGRAAGRSRSGSGLPPDEAVLDRRASWVAATSAVFVFLALWAMRVPQDAYAAVAAPQNVPAALAIALGASGFALFMIGAVRLALGVGRPMTREQFEGAAASRMVQSTPAVYRRGKAWRGGRAEGVSGEMTFTVGDLREGLRSGRVWSEPRLKTAFMMTVGVVAALVGGIGATFVLGSTSTRVIVGLVLAVAIVQAAIGIRRGRRQRGLRSGGRV